MLAGIFFISARVTQLLFLIPLIGLLSYVVHEYVTRAILTPDYVLVLFIASVLAGVWALATLIFYFNARKSGYFLALVDLGLFAALIGGVATLRGIGSANCSAGQNLTFSGQAQLGPFLGDNGALWPKACGVLKASFALGIINILLFFWSFLMALWVHHHFRKEHPEYSSRPTRVVEERYRSSGHNRRSSSRGSRAVAPPPRGEYRDYDRDRRRSRSRGTSRGGYSRSGVSYV